MYIMRPLRSFKVRIASSPIVSFGVKIAPLRRDRSKIRWHRKRPSYPPTLARSRSISLLTLFFLCFVLALARPCLPLTKAYRGQYFFRYYHYVFRLLIFVHFRCVALFSLSFSLYSLSLRLVTNTDEMIKIINCLSIVVI